MVIHLIKVYLTTNIIGLHHLLSGHRLVDQMQKLVKLEANFFYSRLHFLLQKNSFRTIT